MARLAQGKRAVFVPLVAPIDPFLCDCACSRLYFLRAGKASVLLPLRRSGGSFRRRRSKRAGPPSGVAATLDGQPVDRQEALKSLQEGDYFGEVRHSLVMMASLQHPHC